MSPWQTCHWAAKLKTKNKLADPARGKQHNLDFIPPSHCQHKHQLIQLDLLAQSSIRSSFYSLSNKRNCASQPETGMWLLVTVGLVVLLFIFIMQIIYRTRSPHVLHFPPINNTITQLSLKQENYSFALQFFIIKHRSHSRQLKTTKPLFWVYSLQGSCRTQDWVWDVCFLNFSNFSAKFNQNDQVL